MYVSIWLKAWRKKKDWTTRYAVLMWLIGSKLGSVKTKEYLSHKYINPS